MILIGFGANLPFCGLPPEKSLGAAMRAVAGFSHIVEVSSLYRSPAWPDPADPSFVNAAAVIETGLNPAALLEALHAVESAFCRDRRKANAPRTMDIDLLSYGDVVRSSRKSGPNLPHPRLAERDFVLAPLAEIAPDHVLPQFYKTPKELRAQLYERSAIRISPEISPES